MDILVDKGDLHFLKEYKWYISTYGYVVAHETGKTHKTRKKLYLHRLILNPPKDKQVDHINLNKMDNRKTNLRLATESQNKVNRGIQKNNHLGYKDISIHNVKYKNKIHRYYAIRIQADGKRYRWYRKSLTEAIVLRNLKIKELHGEFARL